MGEESDRAENIIAVGIVVLVIVLGIGFWNNWWGVFSTDAPTGPIVVTPAIDEPTKGLDTAPVTIVEYSDFECPFCARAANDVVPIIMQKYVDTGVVRIMFKQFPLTRIHVNAMDAAVASECMFQQDNDLFWKYHDKLFDNQAALGKEQLRVYAEDLGADMTQFDLCLANPTARRDVDQDYTDGVQSGISGTPAFIIGPTGDNVKGELLTGSRPFSDFQAAIERYS